MRVILASPEAKVWSARKHIPLGLGYLAAVLREGGHDVMIYDASIEDVDVEYYLDLAERLPSDPERLYFPHDRHFTPAGHAFAAEAIAQAIDVRGLSGMR